MTKRTQTSAQALLYTNDITGHIACAKHVGYTASTSIERGDPSPHRGIDGDWHAITDKFLADDYGFTAAAAMVEAGLTLACEEC